MKDQQIEKLFDNYADSLSEQPQLAEKARQKMTERRTTKRTSPWWAWIPAVAVCSVVLFVAVFGGATWAFIKNYVRPNQQENLRPTVTYYSVADVKGTNVGREKVSAFIPIEAIRAEYNVISEKYYAFYFKDTDTLAYVKAQIGVETENGVVEISLICEDENYVRRDLSSVYEANIAADGISTEVREGGVAEYVTAAYCTARGMHFYVEVQGNVSTSGDIQKIVAMFA